MNPKRRTETFTTRAGLLAKLIPQCEKEYEETFKHPWSPERVRWVEDLTHRWRTEGEAWRVMNEFRKVATQALGFFEARGLEARRPDNGLYHAYKLHKLVTRRRRFLQSLVEGVEEEYERPAEARHWLAWSMNVGRFSAFAELPYGRPLANRELAIISLLMTRGEEVEFKRGMTIGDAIEQERRRMAQAVKRAPLRAKRRDGSKPAA